MEKVISKAINDNAESVSRSAEHALSNLGRGMAPEEVERFEDQLSGSSFQLATRIALLGYYFLGQESS